MKSSSEKQKKIKQILFAGIVVVLLAAICIFMIPIIRLLSAENGQEILMEHIRQFGIFAPLLFVFLQVVQIVIAFIPGGPIPMIGGALFGTWAGIFLCIAGSFLGTALVYYLVQWIGQPILQLFISEEHRKKFPFLENRKKMEHIVFLLFLCPGLPKDALTYLVSFYKTIPPLRLFFLTTIARTPAVILTVWLGGSLWDGNWNISLFIVALMIVISAIGILIKKNWKTKKEKKHEK